MAEVGSSSAQQEPPQIAQFEYTEEEQESILVDKDVNVRDLIIPVFDLHKIMQHILKHGAQGIDSLNIYKSRLVNAVVPQVPNYPEVVQWCAQGYLPDRKIIMSKDATRTVISITLESIASMLSFPQEVATREWDEEKMKSLYISQPTEVKEKLLVDILKEKKLIAGSPLSNRELHCHIHHGLCNDQPGPGADIRCFCHGGSSGSPSFSLPARRRWS